MTSECPKPVALLGQEVGWVFTETGGKEAGHNLKKNDMAAGHNKKQLEPIGPRWRKIRLPGDLQPHYTLIVIY